MKLSTLMISAALVLPIPAVAQASDGTIVLAQGGISSDLQVEAARQRLAESQAALEAAQASGEGVEAAQAEVAAAQQELAAAEAAAAESQPQEEPQPGAAEPAPAPAEEPAAEEQPAETQDGTPEPAPEEQAAPSAEETAPESAPGAAEEPPAEEPAPAPEEQQAEPSADGPAAEEPAQPEEKQPGAADQSSEPQEEQPQPEASQTEDQTQEEQPVQGDAQQPGAAAPSSAEAEQPPQPAPDQQGEAAPGATIQAQPDASAAPEQLGVKGEEPDAQVQELRQKLSRERRQAEESQVEGRQREGRRRDNDGNDALKTGAAAALGAAAGAIAGQVIQSFGDRVVIERDGQRYIRSDSETDRLLRRARDVDVEDLGEGRTRTVVTRPNGAQIITIRDYDGEIIRRARVTPDGREVVLIDDRWAGPRDRRNRQRFDRDLPPVRYDMPRERYIVDMGRASEDDLQETLAAPPVEQVERAYTLDEVRDSSRLRDKLRRVDLDAITFDTGSAAISRSEISELARIGRAMEGLIARNPNELFLVEGHTDAVGSDLSNLALSDRRAESVAIVLSENFDVPPENLVTQGYGEQYLKVPTEAAERQNRRVTVRRITPLLTGEARR